MGFFSWECKKCGHSILSAEATNSVNDWMNKAIALDKDGSVVVGFYDGYGRLWTDSGMEVELDFEPCIYHHDCWVAAGKPEFDGPSDSAADQGWFFDEEDHNMTSPMAGKPIPPESKPKLVENNLFSYEAVRLGQDNVIEYENAVLKQPLQHTDSEVIPAGSEWRFINVRTFFNENGALHMAMNFYDKFGEGPSIIMATNMFDSASWVRSRNHG